MCVEKFELIESEGIDNSIIRRGFLRNYHQQRTIVEYSVQNVEIISGRNNSYHQKGNGYLQFDVTKRKADNTDFIINYTIRLVNGAFAYCFREDRLSTTGWSDIEHNEYVVQLSTIMQTLTSKDGDSISHFDKFIESEADIENTSLHHMLNNSHGIAANKGKIKTQLPFEHFSGFIETFKNVTKQLGFHLTLKTADLQDINYTTLADISVRIEKIFLYVFMFNPDAETQIMFNESIKISFTLSFDSWTSDG